MKTEFKFSNLLGTVYCKGNILFTPDGDSLISPVGNRVSVFDLVNNKSYTLPFAHRRNISQLALTPQGNLLLSIDEDGKAILTNLPRQIALYHFSFKGSISALEFSPSGRHFAVGFGRFVEVWQTPSTPDSNANGELRYAPFVKHRSYAGHFDQVRSLEWSRDSRFILSAARDLTARIWSLNPEEGFVPTTLAGHREAVLGAWFSEDQEAVYTVSRDGALFEWSYAPGPHVKPIEAGMDSEDIEAQMRWRIKEKHFFLQNNAKVTCAVFHSESNLFVVGFSTGNFCLYEMPDFNLIHNLSISQNDIDFVTINKKAEWLAFGASKLGQLLVWEWQSESYILKQQGHYDSLNTLTYSPSGSQVVTCADDGKIKLWDVASGFCIVTFTEHSSGVTACGYAKRGNVLFTASLDGSIRAWDLIRYRNFKVFTAPTRLSFNALAVDPSGEVVCAGSMDSFDIYIWSVQTGQLLDQLSGHEGPVSSLAFSPNGDVLVSGSWDHTVRIWSVFARNQSSEPIQLQADVLCVAFRPDGLQIAVSTLDGQLTFWSIEETSQVAGLDGRRDVSGGRKLTDRRSAANAAGTKHFSTITYSGDGTCVLAGGNSKYICLYDCLSGTLVKKYTVSINLSLSGTQEFLNSRLITEAGPDGLLDGEGEASDLEERIDRSLPGTMRGDLSARKHRAEVRVPGVAFSPTGRSFCTATTEGLLIYSLDDMIHFDPFDLDVAVTPKNIIKTLEEKKFLRALVMAFRLNEQHLLRKIYEGIPVVDIRIVAKELPTAYIGRLLRWVAQMTEESPHLEFNLLWIEAVVSNHGQWIQANQSTLDAELRAVARAVSRIQAELTRLAEENTYMIDYLASKPLADVNSEQRLINQNAFPESKSNGITSMELDSDDGNGWVGLGS